MDLVILENKKNFISRPVKLNIYQSLKLKRTELHMFASNHKRAINFSKYFTHEP